MEKQRCERSNVMERENTEKLKKRRKQKKKKRKQRVIEVSWTCNDGVIETQGPIESVVYQFVVPCVPIDKISLFLKIPILLTCTILYRHFGSTEVCFALSSDLS